MKKENCEHHMCHFWSTLRCIHPFATSFGYINIIHTFSTKITCMINLIVVIKVVNLDINRIYNHNHMIGMDKKIQYLTP